MAEEACHVVASTTQVGLIQALGAMPPIGYILLAASLLGIAAIWARHNTTLRRLVIYLYCGLIALSGFALFAAAPRIASSSPQAAGGIWSSEAAKGAAAMYEGVVWFSGTLFVVGVVLAVLALRPPKPRSVDSADGA